MELSLENLSKKYNEQTAVNKLNFVFKHGVYGLLGVNGAGKTTLMNMICTLSEPSNGVIKINGNDIFEMGDEYRNIIGYLPQKFGYYHDLTVNDYLMYIAALKGLENVKAFKKINELIEKVGMKEKINIKMGKLSGGMLRRVGIVQAMLNNPQILILDEPTAGLDPNERIRFRNLISEISLNKLVILSTHIVSDIEFIAENVILMSKGKFLLSGDIASIVDSIDAKVWTCTVSRENLPYYSSNYIVANEKTVSEGIEIRVLSKEQPSINAKVEKTTLEDAFLYSFGERGGK